MNSKRAQSEIITTVLIILLVLAAIIIVWQVVSGTVGGASKKSQTAADCLNTGLSIATASGDVSDHTITVTLTKSGASNLINPSGMQVLTYNADGTSVPTCSGPMTNLGVAPGTASAIPTTAFGQSNIFIANNAVPANCVLVAGTTYTVKIAPSVGTAAQCEPIAQYSFTAVA